MERMKWRSALERKNAVRTIALALALAARSMAIGQVATWPSPADWWMQRHQGRAALHFTVTLHDPTDSSLIGGTLSGEDGRWTMEQVRPGDYDLRTGGVGYGTHRERIHVGA
ncbi:MAG: carboxypeptidase-like regulatory domain-containing protein [Flavobacteriales bacterium]